MPRMDHTEDVEMVLPDRMIHKVDANEESQDSGTKETDGSKSKGGLLSRGRGISKKLAKIRQYTRSQIRASSSGTLNPKQNASPSKSKSVKDESRDTEEVHVASQPVREESPTPTVECSLTDDSMNSQPSTNSQPKPAAAADDEPTIIDTTSIYGKITGVLSPNRSTIDAMKEEESATSSTESVMTATAALVRGQSGISVCSKNSINSRKSTLGNSGSPEQDDILDQASVEVTQEDVSNVAKPEEGSSVGHSWAKKISLKVGGFEKSFQISDPVAAIADKMNEVMGSIDDFDLVKQAETMEHKEVGRDYDENPTKLFLLLQQKAWGMATMQLEKHPEEAQIWVYRKFATEQVSNVNDCSGIDESQELVLQETDLSAQVSEPSNYRWRLLPLHASIVLGAPEDLTTKILHAYPDAARKVDERGSLPVHLAASRLDADEDGEKIVLQLFGAYSDSIDIKDSNGRTAPELAKLARARKEAEMQRLMETASRSTRLSRCCVETSASVNGREAEDEEHDDDDDGDDDYDDHASVKSSFSARFRNMMKGSKSMDVRYDKRSNGGETVATKSDRDDDAFIADDEGMAPGFSFLTVAQSTDDREVQTIVNEVNRASYEENESITTEYMIAAKGLSSVPADALQLSLPASLSFGDASVRSARSCSSKTSKSSKKVSVPLLSDESSVVSAVVETITASTDTRAGLRSILEKACENAGRPGIDVTKYLNLLEEEWVTDVEAIRRLDGATLDSILPAMLSLELQRLVNHSNAVDREYLRQKRGRRKRKSSKNRKKKKKRSARKKPAPRLTLDPIDEEINDYEINAIAEEEEYESDYSTTMTESSATCYSSSVSRYDESDDQSKLQMDQEALEVEARHRFPTREALEDAIQERQAAVSLAVSSSFDVDRQTLAQAALADDEVRKLLPLRLVLPTATDLREMKAVLMSQAENSLKFGDLTNAFKIQTELDEIQAQIDEEEKYLRRKSRN